MWGNQHILMGIQAILLFLISTATFFIFVPLGICKAIMDGDCLLYATLERQHFSANIFTVTKGDSSSCTYVTIFCLFLMSASIILGSYLFAVYCTRREAFGLEAAFCAPFPTQIIIHSVVLILTFIVATILTLGFHNVCYGQQGCSIVSSQAVFASSSTYGIFSIMQTAKAASWIVFLLYFVFLCLYLLRWYREKLDQSIPETVPFISTTAI